MRLASAPYPSSPESVSSQSVCSQRALASRLLFLSVLLVVLGDQSSAIRHGLVDLHVWAMRELKNNLHSGGSGGTASSTSGRSALLARAAPEAVSSPPEPHTTTRSALSTLTRLCAWPMPVKKA